VTLRNIRGMLVRPNVMLTFIAIIAGAIGATAADRLVRERAQATEAELRAQYTPRQVVVAARDLSIGQELDAGMLALRQMPTDFVPASALSGNEAGSLIGRRLTVSLGRGDPLQPAFAAGDSGRQLATLIRPGMRAVTIAVDSTNSMSGLLSPGDFVDLYYSRESGQEAVLLPLLENVEVLAAGDDVAPNPATLDTPGGDGRAYGTLTILVSPDAAARVVLAQASGTLTVLMRSKGDNGPAEVVTRSSSGLLVQGRGPGRGRPASAFIEVIVGGSGVVVPEVSRLTIGGNRPRRAGDVT
jgi:pilus assembly protein CpaB